MILYSADQIFQQYEPERFTNVYFTHWQISNFTLQTNKYIQAHIAIAANDSMRVMKALYAPFFQNIVQSGNTETATYYLCHGIFPAESEPWIKKNSAAMNRFADWFEKSIPENKNAPF